MQEGCIFLYFRVNFTCFEKIAEQQPDSKIVMISIYDTSPYIQSSLKAGASGYVLKDAAGSDLPAAIRSVDRGRRFYSQRIADKAREVK